MTRHRSRGVLVFIAAFCFSAAASFSGEKRTFFLTEDLSIGAEGEDDNLIFASVASIGLDAAGNIYILDWAGGKIRVQVFDPKGKFLKSIALPQGQGPAEVGDNGAAVAVGPAGTVFVLDKGGRKVILFDKNGTYLRLFKVDFEASDIGYLNGDKLIILGLNHGKILHLYDKDGRLLESFGEPFEVPSKLSQYKDIPSLRYPMRFSSSPDGSIYVLNPHRFEVSIFKDAKLIGEVEGQSDLFEPVRVTPPVQGGFSIFFPILTVLKSGERLYVTVRHRAFKKDEQNEMIVYENNKRVGSLTLPGMPLAIDVQGRLNCSEETDFPRLVRYVVREK